MEHKFVPISCYWCQQKGGTDDNFICHAGRGKIEFKEPDDLYLIHIACPFYFMTEVRLIAQDGFLNIEPDEIHGEIARCKFSLVMTGDTGRCTHCDRKNVMLYAFNQEYFRFTSDSVFQNKTTEEEVRLCLHCAWITYAAEAYQEIKPFGYCTHNRVGEYMAIKEIDGFKHGVYEKLSIKPIEQGPSQPLRRKIGRDECVACVKEPSHIVEHSQVKGGLVIKMRRYGLCEFHLNNNGEHPTAWLNFFNEPEPGFEWGER